MMEITKLGAFSGEDLAKQFATVFEGSVGSEETDDEGRKHQRERYRRLQAELEMMGSRSRMPALKDAAAFIRITRYYSQGGLGNYRNLFLFLLKNYLGCSDLPEADEPVEYPDYGIFDPLFGFFSDITEYRVVSGYEGYRPTIGYLFYGGMHLDQNIAALQAFIDRMPAFNHLPVYSNGFSNLEAMGKYFMDDGTAAVDAVVCLMWFRLNGGPMGGDPEETATVLRRMNVPVFAPACMFSQDISKWKEDPAGLSPIMSIMAVIWPELDGCIEPIPCCGAREVETEGGLLVRDVTAIEDRIDRIATRIGNWIALKRKNNAEKRIAIIIYNYPPGEGNTGGAAYLDVFVSVRRMLERLAGENYSVELPQVPLHELFGGNALTNTGTWYSTAQTAASSFQYDLEEYLSFFAQLPDDMKAEMTGRWGPPPGEVMVHDRAFIIPGIEFGNIFVGIQPSRPPLGEQDLAGASHDKTAPPHHQYIAFYQWLETVWNADLVFHVGTHGLAEFTRGKEIGMSSHCYPDLLIGNMPHLYIYHVVNTSESTIAKRRLYGTMISYNSPPYSTSDLYERYVELEDLIDELEEAERQGQDIRAERVTGRILALAGELNLPAEGVTAIHLQLYEMKRRIIPQGLHIIGEIYGTEARKRFVEFILRYDREDLPSVNRLLALSIGLDYDRAIHNRDLFARQLEELDLQARLVADTLIDESIEAAVRISGLSGKYAADLSRTLSFGLALSESYADNRLELGNCLRGLDMSFIEARLGGDVVRTPEVLPTGTNLNQFDPTRVPTAAAGLRGAEIAENTIRVGLEKDGAYPESIGIILWGFETTKTGGETIGQILHYLGVRILRRQGSWYPELGLIPLEELGRPRIDCMINICGFFRDMFPNLITLLNRAFALVSECDEPTEMNYVRKHSMENLAELSRQEGEEAIDRDTAKQIAFGRIYGPRAGEYGTRMLGFVEDSVWRDESDLAALYIDSMNYLYADNLHARKTMGMYRRNLSHVSLISQVRDSVDYEITDLDHYFEFFGGLSKAIETVSGNKPSMVVSDTTEEVIRSEDVRIAIGRATRTRLLNPKWIDEMLRHDFHGAQVIEERVYNMLGLAATTSAVDNWIWSSIASRFVFDEEMRGRLEENNRFAASGLVERLIEAESRGYWEATEEEREQLRAAYLELEAGIEERV